MVDGCRRQYHRTLMPAFYINTYDPLVASKAGREASREHGLPPFVDGSIRREPDLEHEFPSISCLCRAGKFAPRLCVGDLVAYMTKKGRYQLPMRHWRLTAILEVRAILQSHAGAATWYRSRGLPLPNNCWVRGNSARPLDESHRKFRTASCVGARRTFRMWDAAYRLRSMQFGTFVVCKPLFRDLSWDAPVVEDRHFFAAFGRIPGTHNPGRKTFGDFHSLMSVLGLDVPLSSQ
jgi:hypothetical protein